jgi:hypothetical protein
VANPQSLNRYAYVLNNPATLVDPQGLSGCVPGTLNCKTLPTCTTMTCAWEYYGGALFEDFGAQAETGLICVANGVVGYCNGSELSSFISPTGSDAFDALDPSSGVYWNPPPGSPTTALNGETAVSPGSVGFSDLLWGAANGASGWATYLGPNYPNNLQFQDFVNGNYGFDIYPGLATSQYPGVSAFPVAPDLPPLPPWWFTGQ